MNQITDNRQLTTDKTGFLLASGQESPWRSTVFQFKTGARHSPSCVVAALRRGRQERREHKEKRKNTQKGALP